MKLSLKLRLLHLRARFNYWVRDKVWDWLRVDDLLFDLERAQVRFEIDLQDQMDDLRREDARTTGTV